MGDRDRSSCSRPAAPAGICFPREALAEALQRRGVRVDLATDERATRYGA